jgi:hypothetical protein
VSSSDFVIDSRRSGDLRSDLGTRWRVVSDAVMGGVSDGALNCEVVEGRSCLRLRGEVSLANNGGFLQASLDLAVDGLFDASAYSGLALDVFGNGASYNLHLRTADAARVWQSYRSSFEAPPRWQQVRLPFAGFRAHRLDTPLDLRRLRRIGLVAIGRAFTADVCIARAALFA